MRISMNIGTNSNGNAFSTNNGNNGNSNGVHGNRNGVHGNRDGVHGNRNGVHGNRDGVHGNRDGLHGNSANAKNNKAGIETFLNFTASNDIYNPSLLVQKIGSQIFTKNKNFESFAKEAIATIAKSENDFKNKIIELLSTDLEAEEKSISQKENLYEGIKDTSALKKKSQF